MTLPLYHELALTCPEIGCRSRTASLRAGVSCALKEAGSLQAISVQLTASLRACVCLFESADRLFESMRCICP
jgi:hypothetical protein